MLCQDAHKKTLVLDLDETLVHSSFKPIPDPDYIIPVEIEGKVRSEFATGCQWGVSMYEHGLEPQQH